MPRKYYVYNTHLSLYSNISQIRFNSSSSYGLTVFRWNFFKSSYSVTIVLDSLLKLSNNEDCNIQIISINIPNYNLTINNLHSSDTDGIGLDRL